MGGLGWVGQVRTGGTDWLAAHGFHYVALPPTATDARALSFIGQCITLCAQRFYAHNQAVATYIIGGIGQELPLEAPGRRVITAGLL